MLVVGYWRGIRCRGVGGGSQLGGVWILREGGLGRIFGGCLGRFGGLDFGYVGVRGYWRERC